MNLIKKLKAAGLEHRGTDLGGLLQWAALHVEEQDEALAELRELNERQGKTIDGLRAAIAGVSTALDAAQTAVQACDMGTEIDICRDISGHINISHASGDQDYTKGKLSCRHIDLREKAPKKKEQK